MRIVPLSLFPAFVHLCIAPASAGVLPSPRGIGSTLSGFIESLKGAFVPSNQLNTFQEDAQRLGPQAGYVVLDEITKVYEGAAQFVTDLKNAAEQIVQHSRKTAAELEEIIGKNNITMTELASRLEEKMSGVDLGLKEKENLVARQLPECDADARAQLVAQVLDKVQPVYVVVLTEAGVPPEQAEDQYHEFAARVRTIFLIIGKLIDKYPMLLDIVIFAVSMLLMPEIPVLQCVLRLLGFGLLGPIKGSSAAWLQSRIWGRAVARGSWFAILQRAGMKLTGSWLGNWLAKLVASVGLAAFFGYGAGPGQE